MSRASDYRDGMPLRRWRVKDDEGLWHELEAHFCFDNNDDGRGLVFRRYIDDDSKNRTHVVASFAAGSWKFYMEITDGQE